MQYRILIADEDKIFSERVGRIFQDNGFIVNWANSGNLVLEQAKILSPHLILLEVETPNLDGIKLCKIIRSTPDLSNIIVAFLTKQIDDYIQVSAFKAGCDDFFFKTINPHMLTFRIMAHLNRQSNKSGFIKENIYTHTNNNLLMEHFSIS